MIPITNVIVLSAFKQDANKVSKNVFIRTMNRRKREKASERLERKTERMREEKMREERKR